MAIAEKKHVYIEGSSRVKPIPQFDAKGQIVSYMVPEGFWSPDVEAIVNASSGEFVQTVTPMYAILQHGKYYEIVVEELKELGYTDLSGYFVEQNDGSNVRLRVIFKDVFIEEPGMGQNIGVGGEFSNSFDSKYAARGCAYYMRFSCTNQMVLKNVIPESMFARNHIADTPDDLIEAVTGEVETFVKRLVSSEAQFKNVMIDAMTDDIRLGSYDELMALNMDVFKVRLHAEEISKLAWELASKPYKGASHSVIDRWDLYNAAVAYASHTDISPQVADLIQFRAENRILNPPVSMPVAARR